MFTRVCVCVRNYIYMYVCTYICADSCRYNMCTYTFKFTCMHAWVHTYAKRSLHTQIYICMYIYIFIHMYMHITYTYPHMFYIFHRRFRNFATSHLSWGLPSGRGLEPSRGEGGCSNGVLGYGGFHKWGYLNRWEHGWEYDGNNVGCWLVTPPLNQTRGDD